MSLPKWAITVTPLSKLLALTLFISLPILGFYLGMIYQRDYLSSTSLIVTYPTTAPRQVSRITLDEAINWRTYANVKYKYSFKYPPELTINKDYGSRQPDNTACIDAKDINGNANLNNFCITALDPSEWKNLEPNYYSMLRKGLNGFVNDIWQLNRIDKKATVNELTETKIDGKQSFQFTISGVFNSGLGSELLDMPKIYIYTSTGNYIYEISFSSSSSQAQMVLKTLTLSY